MQRDSNHLTGSDNLSLNDWRKLNKYEKQFFPNHDFLIREYLFDSDQQTNDFISKILNLAKIENHHPLLIFEWHKVTLSWSSHDKKTISEIDYRLANQSDEIYQLIMNRE